jgi:uncharacterized paraquat-inducible protein A
MPETPFTPDNTIVQMRYVETFRRADDGAPTDLLQCPQCGHITTLPELQIGREEKFPYRKRWVQNLSAPCARCLKRLEAALAKKGG